jgi:FkbM family methyltransferase
VKSAVFGFYGVPFSRHGLEPGLVPFLPGGAPITLVDVGASGGHFTQRVLDHCGVRRALLVEPQPARCRELEARFADPRFAVAACAASDADGSAELDILNWDYSSSLLPVLPDVGSAGGRLDLAVRERVAVPTRTLDELVAEAGISAPIDLLKIDTQGTELHVLRGAARALPRVRMIWIEVSFRPLYDGSALFADVHAFLRRHDFRLNSIHEGFRGADGELLQADALFLSPMVRTAAS